MLSIIMFLSNFSLNATILIEPYTGYTLANPLDFNDRFVDSYMGGRVGVGVAGLTLGLDYMHGKQTGEYTSKRSYMLESAKGFYANISIIAIRFWATYFFETNYKQLSGPVVRGDGIAAGVGFYPIPFLNFSVNAEYRLMKPVVGVELKEYAVSIGLPFHF